ncbi:hypothetical protein EU805_06760 [Salipiger sp. IMCC34102]|uniref:hypothetical protein n=1 Tax=Salipiger sp. IMCC34102 TaxID=2510647 RepID=UPI00101BA1CE|nr:hypothetical protein [Salipiger sp. IMCC34102]RYH03415.1 hypothetical protein EU805_06760 [Salipiger sp. IMCC34102]
MKLTLTTGAALLLTTAATAGGIDRTLNNYSVLFEDGNYAELAFSFVRPDVTGEYPTALGGGSTGVMSEDYETAAFSMKYELNPTVDLGLFVNQPFGADASYPEGLYTGLAAEWDSNQVALVLKYQATPNISVYGGVRSIESQADILIPNALVAGPIAQSLGAQAQADGAVAQEIGARALAIGGRAQDTADRAQAAAQQAAAAAAAGDLAQAQTLGARAAALGAQAGELRDNAVALGAQAEAQGAAAQALGAQAQAIGDIAQTASPTDGPYTYRANTESDRRTSYIIGAAYERPEIALRVALTYESGYTHEFESFETIPALAAFPVTSVTEIEMPDVLTLDFQTGVAPGTLVFGSIRHATWSDWQVAPAGYLALTGGPVTGIDDDVTTYRIGVGRAFTDQLSGFARFTYEDGNGTELSRLAPTDGSRAFGIGGSYTRGAVKFTGGLEYIDFGDGNDASGTVFADNDAVGLGLSVGYSF